MHILDNLLLVASDVSRTAGERVRGKWGVNTMRDVQTGAASWSMIVAR